MGLAIQPTRRIGGKIATLIAVFALIAQPMYGLVAERVANATGAGTTETIVRPDNFASTGWTFYDDCYIKLWSTCLESAVSSNATNLNIADNPTAAPGNLGAVKVDSSAPNHKLNLSTKLLQGTEIKNISHISYAIHTQNPGNAYLNLLATGGGLSGTNRLTTVPSVTANSWTNTGNVLDGAWTLSGGNKAWPHSGLKNAIPWTEVVANYGNAKVSNYLHLRSDTTLSYFDHIRIQTNSINVAFNFEPSEIIPATPQGLKSESNGKDVTNGYTNADNVKNSWLPATNAVKYNYEFSKPNGLATYAIATTSTSIQGAFHLGDGPDGKYNFRVQSVSATGTTSAWSDLSSVTLDRKSPVVSINPTPTAAGPIHGTVSFEVSVDDDNIDTTQLQNTKLIFSNKNNWSQRSEHTVDLSGGPVTVTTDTSTWSDGEYMWRVPKFTDLAGNNAMGGTNTNGGPYDLYFRWYDVDNTLPTISIKSFQGDEALRIFREVSFGYYDANKVAYAVFNGTTTHDFGDAVWSNTDTVWANRGWTGVIDGPNTVDLYDLAGNKSSLDFTIDRTAPNDVNIVIDNDVNPSEAIISAKDTHLNRIDVSLWKEGEDGYVAFPGEWINPIGTNFSKDYASRLNLANLADGNYEIRATAGDAAGNSKNAESMFFTIDRTPPAIAITSATPSRVSGTVGADATEVWVKVGGRLEQRATYTPGETTWTLTISPALTAGADVIARAVDAANNTNSASTNPKWATRTISVPTNTSTRVTNGPLVPGNGTPSQGGSSAVLANTTTGGFAGFLNANTVIDDTAETDDATDEDGEVAAAVTDNDDNGEVKAAEDVKDSWSLINLLLTIAVAAASIFALIGLAGKKEDRNIGARLLTVVPALGAGAVLLFAEDFSGQMSWVNIWTLLVGALLIVQMIILANTKSQAE